MRSRGTYNMTGAEFLHWPTISINFTFIIYTDIIIHSTNTEFITIQRMRINTVEANLFPTVLHSDKSVNFENQYKMKVWTKGWWKRFLESFYLGRYLRWLFTTADINGHDSSIFPSTEKYMRSFWEERYFIYRSPMMSQSPSSSAFSRRWQYCKSHLPISSWWHNVIVSTQRKKFGLSIHW